ncbi:MAG: hypothetical protein LC437_05470 [Thiohalomonas sp.]|nr:hypothetical protein [Thiohalomonas sp.]
MKHLESINFIESLARGTQHFHQEIIRQSLLKTLQDFSFNADCELYRLYNMQTETRLSLIATDKDDMGQLSNKKGSHQTRVLR